MNSEANPRGSGAPGDGATQVLPADAGITIGAALPPRLTDGHATIAYRASALASSPAASGSAATKGQVGPATPRYAIIGHAGSGGMATVHVAQDLELMRKVALKQLVDEASPDDASRLRFLREVQITAQLDHPHIIPVYGLEVAPDGAPAYAMKFIQGRTLGDLIEDARAAARESRREPAGALPMRLEHFLKVCDAVEYAHAKGVMHRDLKPANVMIGPHHEIYVMDWGICRLFGQEEPAFAAAALADHSGGGQTEYGAVIGTPRYMSPEQAQGRSEALGPRSDQCALGLILQELVTLAAPYAGNDVHAVLDAAAKGHRQPLVDPHGRRLPAPLRAIIDRATAVDPAGRYAGVAALAEDLRRYLRGEAVLAMPDTLWQQALRYVGRHRQQILLGVLGLLAIGALGFILLLQRHQIALDRQQQRAALLEIAVAETTRKGDELQLRLLRLEGELDALAASATQLLLHGVNATEPPRWREDYLDPLRRPADYGSHPGYAQPVSLEYGVWLSAPGVDRAAVESQAQRLMNLLRYRNALFAEIQATLGSEGVGVGRLVLALESGLAMVYPGRAGVAPDFDPRRLPGYAAALDSTHASWGEPYVEAETGELLLPLAEALRDADGRPLGVVWIDVPVDHIVRNLLGDTAGDRQVQLLDADGHVLASQEVISRGRDGNAPRQAFAGPGLRDVMQGSAVGAIEIEASGETKVVTYDRIHPLGWTLVETRPAARVFAGARP